LPNKPTDPVAGRHQRRDLARSRFATTRWSVVLRATGKDGGASNEALADLCETYWYPLYAYARRRGYSCEDAQDVTQSFFARLLAGDLLARATPERGRFRAYLLVAFKYFIGHTQQRAAAAKRGGPLRFASLQDAESRYQREPSDPLTPEMLYERQWALTLIATTVAELKQDAERRGRREEFEALRPLLSGDDTPYQAVAAQLEMTVGAVKVAVHRLRRRFARVLREQIADTVGSAEAIDDELRRLLAAVGHRSVGLPQTPR